jgi:IstB-like ATP binding protein
MRSRTASTVGLTPGKNRGELRSVSAQLRVIIWSALNRAFKEWKEVFPNAACVVSLIDRLVHRCEVVAIEGESYRLKEAKDRAALKAAARTAATRKAKKT